MNQIQFWIVFFLHTVNQFNHTNITPQKFLQISIIVVSKILKQNKNELKLNYNIPVLVHKLLLGNSKCAELVVQWLFILKKKILLLLLIILLELGNALGMISHHILISQKDYFVQPLSLPSPPQPNPHPPGWYPPPSHCPHSLEGGGALHSLSHWLLWKDNYFMNLEALWI